VTDISMRRNGVPGDMTVPCIGSGSARTTCTAALSITVPTFHYDGMGDEEEESIFRFDRHRFVVGEYVSITEHDGVQRTFRVAEVLPTP
jgi:hypothetical protein